MKECTVARTRKTGIDNRVYFDRVAESWDDLRSGFFSLTLREKAMMAANMPKDGIAADIGAGSGFVSEGLLQIGHRVVAVDHSEGMIAQLQKRFGNNALFAARNGESEALPLDDDSFDCVFANMYLHHVESPRLSILEMARIVKPGGKLVVTDLDAHRNEFLVKEHCDRWMGFDRADIKDWFETAGLINIRVTCAGENCTARSDATNDRCAVSIFIATGDKVE